MEIQISPLNDDKLEYLLKWYHAAILELLSINGPGMRIASMAADLDISEAQVEEGLKCLLGLGIISKTAAGFSRNDKIISAERSTPSAIIKNYHHQILDKTNEAIDHVPIEKRKNLSAIFSFDSSRAEEARNWIAARHFEFLSEFGNSSSADRVYAVSTHLVPIDKGSRYDN